jgi:uncharacterized protein YjbJ (UPF0337 family)
MQGEDALDKAKGFAKEAAGMVTGNEEMKAEGRADREKAGTTGTKGYIRERIEESNKRSRREA